MTELRFAPVTGANWSDFEKLFETPGAPKYCWCMAWRDMPDRQTASSAERKQAMSGFVEAGTPVGILAYEAGQPVGWCSVAPRNSHRKLASDQEDDAGVWSVTCFFVPRKRRGEGLARALLDAAISHAFSKGASTVEAYPVDPDSPSYRFMGFRQMFAARGFRETGMAGSRRHVMRLEHNQD
jgi:GNAT superfamily N-acetyltransferase